MKFSSSIIIVLVLSGLSTSCFRYFECTENEVRGTYLLKYNERPGGTCGPIPEQLVNLNDRTIDEDEATCETDEADISEDLCTEEVAFSCVNDVSEFSVVRILEKTAPDGAKLEGSMTLSISELETNQSCISTYDIVAERQ